MVYLVVVDMRTQKYFAGCLWELFGFFFSFLFLAKVVEEGEKVLFSLLLIPSLIQKLEFSGSTHLEPSGLI